MAQEEQGSIDVAATLRQASRLAESFVNVSQKIRLRYHAFRTLTACGPPLPERSTLHPTDTRGASVS